MPQNQEVHPKDNWCLLKKNPEGIDLKTRRSSFAVEFETVSCKPQPKITYYVSPNYYDCIVAYLQRPLNGPIRYGKGN